MQSGPATTGSSGQGWYSVSWPSAALLVENLVAVYFSLSMQTLYASDPLVGETVLVMRSLEFLAVGLLAYVTLQ